MIHMYIHYKSHVTTIVTLQVLRVFEAPQNFVGNIRRISHVELAGEVRGGGGGGGVPLGASLPSLGLSNKAVFTGAASLENKGEAPVTKNSFADHIPAFSGVDLSGADIYRITLFSRFCRTVRRRFGGIVAANSGCLSLTLGPCSSFGFGVVSVLLSRFDAPFKCTVNKTL